MPGPQRVKFTFGRVSTGGQRGFQQVFVHISSLGNVLTKPTGKVTIFDTTGKAVETLSYTMDTFLPQTAIDYPILLKKALAPGDYRAVTTLTAAGTTGAVKTFTASETFSISKTDVKQVFTSASPTQAPPAAAASSSFLSGNRALYGGAAIGALVILLLLLWLIRARRLRAHRHPPTTVQPSPAVLAATAAEEPPPVPLPPVLPEPPAEPAGRSEPAPAACGAVPAGRVHALPFLGRRLRPRPAGRRRRLAVPAPLQHLRPRAPRDRRRGCERPGSEPSAADVAARALHPLWTPHAGCCTLTPDGGHEGTQRGSRAPPSWGT